MLAVSGFRSRITEHLLTLLPPGEESVRFEPERLPFFEVGGRYFFCAGYMAGTRIDEAGDEEAVDAWAINFARPAAAIETILRRDPEARIVVMGSESGISGSYDMAYAGAKAAMHRYVESRRLSAPGQQLVCVAPSIIIDGAMTTRRTDGAALREREKSHVKGRFVTSLEVARLVHFLLYVDEGYISNVVIRMNGGEHATR